MLALVRYPAKAPALAVAAVALSLASCAQHAHGRLAFASAGGISGDDALAVRPTLTNDGQVILVTLDGVRAEDVFDGADPSLRPAANVALRRRPQAVMPRTSRLVASRGVALGADRPGCGTVRTASGANVSLPGYLEIFSGHKTLCRDNACPPTERATVLDEAAAAGLTVASIGSWNMLDHAVSTGTSGVFVQTGTHHWPGARPLPDPAFEELVAAGERAAPYPGSGWYRPDAYTIAIALRYLEASSPAVLHVGLGDADEWGHRDDYGRYLEAIGKADAFLGTLADTLAHAGERGARTTVIVTADHGRNVDFRHHGASSESSARSFVLAFGGRIVPRGVVCPTRNVTLADVAPTMRALVGLPPDTSTGAGHAIAEIVASPAVDAGPGSFGSHARGFAR